MDTRPSNAINITVDGMVVNDSLTASKPVDLRAIGLPNYGKTGDERIMALFL
jgi:hypothetical protein